VRITIHLDLEKYNFILPDMGVKWHFWIMSSPRRRTKAKKRAASGRFISKRSGALRFEHLLCVLIRDGKWSAGR